MIQPILFMSRGFPPPRGVLYGRAAGFAPAVTLLFCCCFSNVKCILESRVLLFVFRFGKVGRLEIMSDAIMIVARLVLGVSPQLVWLLS